MKRTYLFGVFVLVLLAISGCSEKSISKMESTELKAGWKFRQAGQSDWMGATVPGTVHTDLMANGKIEDPYYRLNELQVQWIDKTDWEYQTSFEVSKATMEKGRITLDFKGLDTYADISLNGQPVASTDNMFREYSFDVKKYLKEGANELRILFRSPIAEGIKKYDVQGFEIPVSDNDQAIRGQVEGGKKVSVYTRKAGYHFGWDWGPRLTTSGIWRPVTLNAWDEVRVQNLQIVQNSVSEISAKLTAVFEVEAENDGKGVFTLTNEGITLATAKMNISKGIKTYRVDFEIANPKLWWTNCLGEPHLYSIVGGVSQKGNTDSKTTRIGIRTLELVRDKDQAGTTFYFKLNGVPVFMKGANYIPNDVFLPRVTEQNYRNVVNTAKTSNMNMLRVWGGGIYENDIFYDLCDEAGILVWQDFMFACAMFPGDEAFLENVRLEAIDNVKRLRNHPSIGLWCGNNEILAAWYGWGWKKAEEAKSQENADKIWQAYVDIFHKILPDVVKEYDPQRSYWDSSPSSGMGVPSDMVNGDDHYWDVWWGKKPFTTYATHIARFMSEYGFQSFPEMESIKKYALPEDYNIVSEVMNSHQRSSIGNETIEFYMLQEYRKPKDFASFLYVNHVLQAEGIKFALEGHRRAMPYNMGSLYWQINDCWPVASWSSTDYYQKWKALQYYAKKGFEPVLVSPFTVNDSLKVGIVSDRLSPITGQLRLTLIDFSGKVVWENKDEVQVPANSSATYFGASLKDFLSGENVKEIVLKAELIENEKPAANNVFYFLPFKELKVPTPKVEFTVSPTQGGFEIGLSTDKLAKNVFLTIGGEEGFFSDNYFDLLPGEKVSVRLDTKISEEKLKEILSIRTLEGAF